MPDLDQHPVK